MIKTRILAGEEYWEAYRRHKCTGRPVISVEINPDEVEWVQAEKPRRTEWKRRPGDGMWIEIELED